MLFAFGVEQRYCGGLVGLAPPNEGKAGEETGLLAGSSEGGSIPPLHTILQVRAQSTTHIIYPLLA